MRNFVTSDLTLNINRQINLTVFLLYISQSFIAKKAFKTKTSPVLKKPVRIQGVP